MPEPLIDTTGNVTIEAQAVLRLGIRADLPAPLMCEIPMGVVVAALNVGEHEDVLSFQKECVDVANRWRRNLGEQFPAPMVVALLAELTTFATLASEIEAAHKASGS